MAAADIDDVRKTVGFAYNLKPDQAQAFQPVPDPVDCFWGMICLGAGPVITQGLTAVPSPDCRSISTAFLPALRARSDVQHPADSVQKELCHILWTGLIICGQPDHRRIEQRPDI